MGALTTRAQETGHSIHPDIILTVRRWATGGGNAPSSEGRKFPQLVMVDRTQDLPMLLRRQSFSHRNNYRIPLEMAI